MCAQTKNLHLEQMYNNERVCFNVDNKMEGVNVENEKLFGNFLVTY